MTISAIIIILGSILFPQDEIPVDTLLINQGKILQNQEQILEETAEILGEVKYIDPLEGKRFGIEFNPAYFLMSTAEDDGYIITAGYSLFPENKKIEIAFPIYFNTSDNIRIIHIDSHLRAFLGKHRNGFYISTGLRMTNLKGRKGNSGWLYNEEESDEITSTFKTGLTFGIGYRIFGKNDWYWGTSLFAGRYFGEETDYYDAGTANGKIIIDMELLKFGSTF